MATDNKKKILITGAAGFIGTKLAATLISNNPEYHLVLTDIIEPLMPPSPSGDFMGATTVKADLSDPDTLASLIEKSQPLHAVFILHGIMSSGSEADPELSAKVNVNSTKDLLHALAKSNKGVKVIYASSQAVYGPPLPEIVTDAVKATPASVYGTHKLKCENMLHDFHQRGDLSVFVLRFPTVSVRAGKPTQAASSFLSGMIREPMNEEECVIPIVDRGYRAVLTSPTVLVENLLKVLSWNADVLPSHVRWLNFPGVSVTIQEMLDALVKLGGEDKLKFIKEETDAQVERILRSWPLEVDSSTAAKLGLTRDKDAEGIVQEYLHALNR